MTATNPVDVAAPAKLRSSQVGLANRLGEFCVHPWWSAVPAMGIALWLHRRALGDGPMRGDDTLALIRRTEAAHSIWSSGHLDGWIANVALGHEAHLTNPPGFDIVLGLVRLVSFGQLSVQQAMGLVAVLSVMALPVAVGHFARSLGLTPMVAVVAGMVSLVPSSFTGGGMHGMYITGLFPFQLAQPLIFVALASWVRCIRHLHGHGGAHRGAVVAGAWSAAVVLVHPISAVTLTLLIALAAVGLAIGERRIITGADIATVAKAIAVTVGLSAMWLFPMVVHRDVAGASATWTPPVPGDLLLEIWRGQKTLPGWLAQFAVLGWIASLIAALTGRRRAAFAAFLGPCAFFAASALNALLGQHNDLALQLSWRSLVPCTIIGLMPLAWVIGTLLEQVKNVQQFAWPFVLAALIAGTIAKLPDSLKDLPNTIGVAPEGYDQVVSTLRQSVAPDTRFATQPESDDRLNNVRITHVARYLGWASQLNAINIFNPELNRSMGAGYIVDRYRDTDPSEVARQLRRRGVSVLVLHDPAVWGLYVANPNFAVLAETSVAVVLRVQPDGDETAPSLVTFPAGGTASLVRAGSQGYAWDIDASQAGQIELAVGWSPRWSAKVDGRTVPFVEAPDGLIGVPVTAGQQSVELHYSLGDSGWLGLAVTMLTGIWLVFGRRLKALRQSRPPLIAAS
jgi:hypothetical protein